MLTWLLVSLIIYFSAKDSYKEKNENRKIIFILSSSCVALFMFLVPVTQVPDETTHAILAWNITHDAAKEDSLQWLAHHQGEVITNSSPEAPAVLNKEKLNRFY